MLHLVVLTLVALTGGVQSRAVRSDNFLRFPFSKVADDEFLANYGNFVLASMNADVNPCEDFYEYACGNWVNNEYVAGMDGNESLTAFADARLNDFVVDYLENVVVESADSSVAKTKRAYMSCVKAEPNFKEGLGLLLKTVDEAEMEFKRTNNFFGLKFSRFLLPYAIDSKIYLVSPWEVLKENENFNVTTLRKDFGSSVLSESRLEEILRFEEALTTLNITGEEEKKFEVEEFVAAHNESGIDWWSYFNVTFDGRLKNSSQIKSYVKSFKPLTTMVKKTDPGLVLDYLKWRFIMENYDAWNATLRDPKRSEKCLKNVVYNKLYESLLPWMINNTMDEDLRTDIFQIARNIRDTFYEMISGYDWLDEESKAGARTKLRAMDFFVGYNDHKVAHEDFSEKFRELVVDDNFFLNWLSIEKFELSKALEEMDSARPANLPFEINAHHDMYQNSVNLYIGMLMATLHHKELPTSMKYGGIGATIGHEMMHGFDPDLIYFDYKGAEERWLTNSSLRNYKERTSCIEAQFNKFIFDGRRSNGRQTLGESSSDIGGLRMAYFAYLKWMEQNLVSEWSDRQIFSELPFSNKQLFFLQFAQSWCRTPEIDDKTTKLYSKDEHPFDVFRALGTLADMEEFSEAFKCPLGSNMNPLKKCVVW